MMLKVGFLTFATSHLMRSMNAEAVLKHRVRNEQTSGQKKSPSKGVLFQPICKFSGRSDNLLAAGAKGLSVFLSVWTRILNTEKNYFCTYLKEQEVWGGGEHLASMSGVLAWNVLYEVLAAHEPDLQLPRHRRRSREARQRPKQRNKTNKTVF
jgi:hypothetical protein